jgi:glycosyltransferase involved in cell wall biosynthesis
MKLSIIIPVYNTAKFIPDCLNSCLNQKGVKLGEDYEIICVNDGSTDNSLQVLTQFADNQQLSGGGAL